MPIIERIVKSAPSIDYEATIFEAVEYLIQENKECAVVQRDDEIIGIVNLDNLLNLPYEDGKDNSNTEIFSVMEPAIFINAHDHLENAIKIMSKNDVEHLAVADSEGTFLGIISAKEII